MSKNTYRIGLLLAAAVSMLALFGCATRERIGEVVDSPVIKGEKIVGKDIELFEINQFYYTVENINYDAFYLRYMFYKENGSYFFFHEARERKDDYGPATEEDRTDFGTVELTNRQWDAFRDLVEGGTVTKREDDADSGDTGPWLYLYWDGDKDVYQVFRFASAEKEKAFVELCESLCAPLEVSASDYPAPDESFVGNWMGYFHDVSGEYHMTVEQPDASGNFPVTINLVWMSSGNSGDGMNVDMVDITGTASVNDDGLMIFEGDMDDGSGSPDMTCKAVIGTGGEELHMLVLEAGMDQSRICTGNRWDLKRE